MTIPIEIEDNHDLSQANHASSALAVSSGTPMLWTNPLDMPVEMFRAGLDRRKANRDALITWIREALIENVDFGKIHVTGKNACGMAARGRASECREASHWSKPSLFKPGAEKICRMLGVTAIFPTLPEYEKAALAGIEIKTIILRCHMVTDSGKVVADGVGARLVEKDYGDLNRSLKMTEKSAFIDATLRMSGLSELFTQDLEDMRFETEPAAERKGNGETGSGHAMQEARKQPEPRPPAQPQPKPENPLPMYPEDRFGDHFHGWSEKVKGGLPKNELIRQIRTKWELSEKQLKMIDCLPKCPDEWFVLELEVHRKVIAADLKTGAEAVRDLSVFFDLTEEQKEALCS